MCPSEFIALNNRRLEESRITSQHFRFLATVMARSTGADVNFMEDEPRKRGGKRGGMTLDDTEAFFMALASHGKQ